MEGGAEAGRAHEHTTCRPRAAASMSPPEGGFCVLTEGTLQLVKGLFCTYCKAIAHALCQTNAGMCVQNVQLQWQLPMVNTRVQPAVPARTGYIAHA